MATRPGTPGEKDPRSLQELAVDIVTDIHKLSTGLAHAGANPRITQQLEQTSALYAQLAKALAAGPVGQQPTGGESAGPPQAGPPAAAPSQAGPPPGPPPAPPSPGTPQQQAPARGGLHNTIAQMHQASMDAASRATGR